MIARAWRRWVAPASLCLLAGACAQPEPPLWRDWESELYAKGLLREDRSPADAPFTNDDLVRNFSRIAFGLEPQLNAGNSGRDILRRWEAPVRWRLHALGSKAASARTDVTATLSRIAGATGHDIGEVARGAQPNLDIWLLGPNDYAFALDWADRSPPSGQGRLIRDFRANGLPCMGQFSFRVSPGGEVPPGAMTYGIVLVRKGFGRPFRLSCFEEELAQIMGLANDDSRVRPSIFNDDEEFALLTEHDEMLLSLLYDRRLSPGMPMAEAMPIVARLVAERRPGG
ncbi:MAG: DUF2927 domain-containing protein [Pseudomonadota bacterium]